MAFCLKLPPALETLMSIVCFVCGFVVVFNLVEFIIELYEKRREAMKHLTEEEINALPPEVLRAAKPVESTLDYQAAATELKRAVVALEEKRDVKLTLHLLHIVLTTLTQHELSQKSFVPRSS